MRNLALLASLALLVPVSPAAAHDADAAVRLRMDLDRFPPLVARAAWLRAETLDLHARLARRGTPPTGAEIERVRLGTLEHLALRSELMDMALRYEAWLDDESAPALPERARILGETRSAPRACSAPSPRWARATTSTSTCARRTA